MTVLFLADEDLDSDIIDGLRTREPMIDILDVKNAGLRGTAYPIVLDLATQQGRIVGRRILASSLFPRGAGSATLWSG